MTKCDKDFRRLRGRRPRQNRGVIISSRCGAASFWQRLNKIEADRYGAERQGQHEHDPPRHRQSNTCHQTRGLSTICHPARYKSHAVLPLGFRRRHANVSSACPLLPRRFHKISVTIQITTEISDSELAIFHRPTDAVSTLESTLFPFS